MTSSDLYLICFAVGTVWTVGTMLLGGLHFGQGHFSHSLHSGHSHAGHSHPVGDTPHGPHSHGLSHWFSAMINPNGLAVFLAWFGGIGFLLTRHTGLALGLDLAIAVVFGIFGAYLLAVFLRFLQTHEKPLDPMDYQMVGTLARVTSSIRPDGTGELIYTRDGARRPVCARSEEGLYIGRDTEVVITRFERGVAYVRTFDSMLAVPSNQLPGITKD